ncbi:MAG: UDP-N-acetylmuramate dehydrogenase [Lachnospiraceae bacterium]
MSVCYNRLSELVQDGQLRRDEPMSRHTTFRVGGPAAIYAEPAGADELAAVISCCREMKTPYYILGNGSNLLVSDCGYDGVMIAIGKAWDNIRMEGNRIYAGAGAMLSRAARQALDASLTGLEFAAGIPGTVGGAVVMNAGAYGSEMKAVLSSVTVLAPDGEIKELTAVGLELGYRTSCIIREQYVVLEAVMDLQPGDQRQIRGRMDDLAGQRKEKQPLEYPSAGSTFKRPEGYFAGKLIQDAGLRGFRIGDAQVAEKHCGFVINRGNATAADIMSLCRAVQDKVNEMSGVVLELEVKTIGEF